jgi:hypothetical protein
VEERSRGDGKSGNCFAIFALTFHGGYGYIFGVAFMVTLILLCTKCHARLRLHGADGDTHVAMKQNINNEKRREDACLAFNKIIEGHCHDVGNDYYSQVGALFVTWGVNNLQLNGKDSEATCFKANCISRNDRIFTGESIEFDLRARP